MKNLENSCLRVGLVPLDKKSRSRAEFAPESQTKIMTSMSRFGTGSAIGSKKQGEEHKQADAAVPTREGAAAFIFNCTSETERVPRWNGD